MIAISTETAPSPYFDSKFNSVNKNYWPGEGRGGALSGQNPRGAARGVVKTTPHAGTANTHVVRVQKNPQQKTKPGEEAPKQKGGQKTKSVDPSRN